MTDGRSVPYRRLMSLRNAASLVCLLASPMLRPDIASQRPGLERPAKRLVSRTAPLIWTDLKWAQVNRSERQADAQRPEARQRIRLGGSWLLSNSSNAHGSPK